MSTVDRSEIQPRQAPDLMLSAIRHFARLFKGELTLAKQEVSQKASRAGFGVAMFGVALLLALVALNTLAAAAVTVLIALGLSAPLASVIVAGSSLLIAALLIWAAKKRVKPSALLPRRTIENIKKDIHTIKENAHVK